ncbi:Vicinal oxygen chelate [Sesbania bispinosa]|nr:Vicinal oxygen chelate [Sesbania bispinosa]
MAQPEVQNGETEKVAAAAVSFSAVKPRLFVEAPKANDAVSFYKAAFGAEEVGRTLHPKRKAEQELPLVLSAELKISGFSILVSDLTHDSVDAPKSEGKIDVLCLKTEDVGATIAKAVSAGAVEEARLEEGEDMCCGGRVGMGRVKDPYGIVWILFSPSKKKCGEANA